MLSTPNFQPSAAYKFTKGNMMAPWIYVWSTYQAARAKTNFGPKNYIDPQHPKGEDFLQLSDC